MNENVETAGAPIETQKIAQHHIVSLPKFCVLFIGTFGWYLFYWLFKHWSRIRTFKRTKIPSFFTFFLLIAFIFPLFGKIKETLKANRPDVKFANNLCAGAVVLLQLGLLFIGLLPDSSSDNELIALVLIIATLLSLSAWFLSRAQNAANIACGDPKGLANNKFSWLDIIAIIPGGSLWALTIYWVIIPLLNLA